MDSRPADFKSPRLAQEPTTIGGMDICLGLLYVVCLLSVLLLDPFESPGVGQASFIRESPLDSESAILVNTPRVACCHEGGFCIDRSLPWMTEEVKSQGGRGSRSDTCMSS